MDVFAQISMRGRIVSFCLFVACVLLWADVTGQTGEKIEVKSTTLKFIDSGYIGRDSTKNYYYILNNGLKVRAPSSNPINEQFLTEYLSDELVCNVTYFENNSIINNDVSIVHMIKCSNDDLTYSYN